MKSLRLAIDFDDTIAVNAFPEIGELIDGAKEYINKLYDDGHTIMINTCRAGKEEGDAKKFLEDNGIKYHWLNCNRPEDIEHYKQDCRKMSADVYIDDKNLLSLLYGMTIWREIYNIILYLSNKDNE